MKTFVSLLMIAASVACFSSCFSPPDYPEEPIIEFAGLNDSVFIENDPDSLRISFTFTDGDGDIGSDDSLNVFLEDLRVPGFIRPFKIPFIESKGNIRDISGTVTLSLTISNCVSELEKDTLVYAIQMEDRAGNLSNTILTSNIYITCEP